MGLMKIACRGVLAMGLALTVLAATRAGAAPERDNFAFLQTSTVRVVAMRPGQVDRGGTGFIIVAADARNADNAILVTALHIVDRATQVTVVEANSNSALDANIRARDVDRDLAFLEVRGLRGGGTPLTVTSIVPPVGQELRTTGYGEAADRASRSSTAEISGVLLGAYSRSIPNPRPIMPGADVGIAQFQHSIPISFGFSGGPVIDKCGRVVGMNVSNGGAARGGTILYLEPGISFAVASTEIIKSAQDRGIRLTEDSSPCPEPAAARSGVSVTQNGSTAAGDAPSGDSAAPQQPGFFQTRAGLAVIVGAFAVLALGLALWLLLGRSGRSRAVVAEPPLKAQDSLRIPTVAPSQTAAVAATAQRTLSMRGTGPGGEPISLRFTSADLETHPRTIGTESEANVPDNRAKTFVSRSHAEISWDGESFYIKDLKSMNGTQLDGLELKALEKRRLHDGATVKLADVVLVVQID